MGLKIFNVIVWAIAGILNLASDKISKLSYGLAWGVLMLYLIMYCFGY
jgi:hypothetical protein